MTFVKWTEGCSVNQPEMDREHKVFLETINILYKNLSNPKKDSTLSQTLQILEEYANIHFSDEEQLLSSLDYPDLNDQKVQHTFFRDQLSKFKTSLNTATTAELQSLLQFMRDWFLIHIMTLDKKYSEWFAEQDITS